MEISQTQLANFATLAGIIIILLNKVGITFGAEQMTFILATSWSVGWTIYNYIQRYRKGDLTLGGIRK